VLNEQMDKWLNCYIVKLLFCHFDPGVASGEEFPWNGKLPFQWGFFVVGISAYQLVRGFAQDDSEVRVCGVKW